MPKEATSSVPNAKLGCVRNVSFRSMGSRNVRRMSRVSKIGLVRSQMNWCKIVLCAILLLKKMKVVLTCIAQFASITFAGHVVLA